MTIIPNGNTAMTSDNLMVDQLASLGMGGMINGPFQTTSEEVTDDKNGPKKSTLRKNDSFVSYTEPGPIIQQTETDGPAVISPTETEVKSSTTTDDFMAILERNSAILQQATEKNQEIAKEKDNEKKPDPNVGATTSSDDVNIHDNMVEVAKEAITEEHLSNDDKEQSKNNF